MGNKHYQNEEWLKEKYHEERMGFEDIADHASVAVSTIQYWIDKHDIETRRQGPSLSREVSLVHDDRGYLRWHNEYNGEKFTCYVHQLVAIAEGTDPETVFGGDCEIHHKNGIKYDNRPCNIDVLTREKHQEVHKGDYESIWEDE